MKSVIMTQVLGCSLTIALLMGCGKPQTPDAQPEQQVAESTSPATPPPPALPAAPASPEVKIPAPVRTDAPQSVMVMNASAVSDELLKSITNYLADEFALPVTSLTTDALKAKDPAACAYEAVKQRPKNVAFFVVLVDSDSTAIKHLHAFKNAQMSIVNVHSMKSENAKKYAARLYRQAIRAIAFSAEMTETLDPFCVLRGYATLEELDSMGLNFFPPAADEFEKRMRAAHIELTRESVWNSPPAPPIE